MQRKLVAVIACRNAGSRLYAKPFQNLDVSNGITILDQIIDCVSSLNDISQAVLAVSSGIENQIYLEYAKEKKLEAIVGDETDVLSRLITAGVQHGATDVFRVTSESPFLYFEGFDSVWKTYCEENLDAIFLDEIVDGCGFEVISVEALIKSHHLGNSRHRSELCSLFIRENSHLFRTKRVHPPANLNRKDLRLTVDYPEDLIVCRSVYLNFKAKAPRIPIDEIILYLDENPDLKTLVDGYTEAGYKTMYL